MHKLVFATNNSHKISEVSAILGSEFNLLNLKEVGIFTDLPENENTIEGNALSKARFVYEKSGNDCFADDTGLFVDSLKGEPGVYSARYAGEECNSEENIKKLLHNIEGKSSRKAHFKTIVALIIGGREYAFEGIINGEILTEKRGNKGFGYDPVFRPEGYSLSFAEMSPDLKNKISHRALAIKALSDFLKA